MLSPEDKLFYCKWKCALIVPQILIIHMLKFSSMERKGIVKNAFLWYICSSFSPQLIFPSHQSFPKPLINVKFNQLCQFHIPNWIDFWIRSRVRFVVYHTDKDWCRCATQDVFHRLHCEMEVGNRKNSWYCEIGVNCRVPNFQHFSQGHFFDWNTS